MHSKFLFSLLCFLAFSAVAIVAKHSYVYLVLLNEPPFVLLHDLDGFPAQFSGDTIYMPGEFPQDYGSYLIQTHDSLLQRTFKSGTYKKLYSYNHILNGFAVLISEEQAAILRTAPEVVMLEKDYGVKKLTTYTPSYLGLPSGAWAEDGGAINAGEGIVIGVLDTGIDPTHPSFSENTLKPYPDVPHYTGSCEVAKEFPQGSCNKKLVGARHFAAAAIASGQFNATIDFASPLDADGHGTHTSSTATGNNGVPVIVDGLNFGFASGMAPRAHVAAYKALYRGFGGFLADVVAGIEQAVKDHVDILSLSIGPGGPPAGIATFFSIFDIGMLSAVKAGVLVIQAAGNSGPNPQSMLSFGPWICSVAAGVHDRTYPNSMILGNNSTIRGIGLAPSTPSNGTYTLVLASDALNSAATTDGDCQNSSLFQKPMVQGRILVCTYSINFLFGSSTVQNVIGTVQNLSSAGLVMTIPAELDGQLSIQAVPFPFPAIIVSTLSGSTTLLNYYNSTAKFTATTRILGGATAKFSHEVPRVASYSSRGPVLANSNQQLADLLKPTVMAPGSLIWAGWSTIGVDSAGFRGQKFAMISGTSMATPHIAGIAALVKQKNPTLSPAAIVSAIATTASVVDKNGEPLLAQFPSSNTSVALGPATPFDFGGGAVNATAALDPGLVFDAGFDDYVKFLCSIPGAAATVKNTTGSTCDASPGPATDLNLPSITVTNLITDRSIPRKVTNVANTSETYDVKVTEPQGVTVKVTPMEFTINTEKSEDLMIMLIPTETRQVPTFGSIVLAGSQGHIVRVPISVISTTKSTATYRACTA